MDIEILRLIKEGKCFNYKKKEYIMINYLEKAKIFAITDISNVDNIENIDKKKSFCKDKKKRLTIFSLFMLKNLFFKSFFTIQYILINKIMAIILVDTCAIEYSFINKKFVKTVYQILQIKLQYLIKTK